MAITTLAGAEAGIQYPLYMAKQAPSTPTANMWRSWLYHTGFPAASAAPTPGITGAALTTYAGQIPFTNPAAGNTYLSRLSVQTGGTTQSNLQAGFVMLADRLWHNSGLNVSITTSQSVSSVAWPARDANESTNGEGVYIGVEVTTVLGAGTPTYTMNYTDESGNAGSSSTNIIATVATMPVGTFIPMGLAAGDTGVRSIQAFTLSATHTSGAVSLVAYRPIAMVPVQSVLFAGVGDALTLGFPRLWNNSVPFVVHFPANIAGTDGLGMTLLYSQG